MLIVDVEATGVDYKKHSIVSVGALDLLNPSNRFYMECKIWNGAEVMPEALKINGFSDAEVRDPKKATEADLVHAFIKWSEPLTNKTFGGQNPSFDRDFLKHAAERAGHTNWPFAHRTFDSHSFAWMHMIKQGFEPPVDPVHHRSALNLDAVLNYCGIPSEPEPHNALTGAMCHAEVIYRLLYGKKLLPEFEQFDIPW